MSADQDDEKRPPLAAEGEGKDGDSVPSENSPTLPGTAGGGDGNCLLPDPEAAADFLEKWRPGGPWVLTAIEVDPPMGRDGKPGVPKVPTRTLAKRAEKFGATIDTLAKGVAARASEVEASLLNADFPRRDIEAAVAKAAAKARAEVTANSSDARWNALRELDAAAASLETTAQLYANPVAVLSRAGIGTAERTNFLTQLSGAGPVGLRQMALLAASTGNRVMGAALVSIIDRMPRKDRPFSAADLAERLVGDETRKVQAAIATVRHAAQTAIVRNRSWEAGKASPLDRIKLALNNPHRKEA